MASSVLFWAIRNRPKTTQTRGLLDGSLPSASSIAFRASSNLSSLIKARAESNHRLVRASVDRWYRSFVRVVAWTTGSVGWKIDRILVLVPMEGVGLWIERYSAVGYSLDLPLTATNIRVNPNVPFLENIS